MRSLMMKTFELDVRCGIMDSNQPARFMGVSIRGYNFSELVLGANSAIG